MPSSRSIVNRNKFQKRKTELKNNLKDILIDDILNWTDEEYDNNLKFLKKCKMLRRTHQRLNISTTESETEPAPESETEPAPESETEPAPESETEPAPESETEPAPESEPEPPKKKQKKKSKKIIIEEPESEPEPEPPKKKQKKKSVKKIKQIEALNEQLKDSKINKKEFEYLNKKYKKEIAVMKIQFNKQKLIQKLIKDNPDINSDTIKFYLKNNLNNNDEITDKQYEKIEKKKIKDKKNQLKKLEIQPVKQIINITVDYETCIKKNNTLIEKYKKLQERKKTEPTKKDSIKNQINKIKYNIINNPKNDELTMLKFQKLYGKNDDIMTEAINKRIDELNPVKRFMI
jgi:uncharacterized protein YneF (UPF0154 family)